MKLLVSTRIPDPTGDDAALSADSWGGETDWGLIRKASVDATGFDRDRVWSDLVHRYERPVRRVLGRHLRGDPAVEEAVADFFSELFRRRQILGRADPGQGRFRCYIQGVIRRYALQWKRAHGASLGQDIAGVDVAEDVASEVEREEELAWADAILEHAIGRLEKHSSADAELLRRFYGLFGRAQATSEELARERGTSTATLHVALHRARGRLKTALNEELVPMVESTEDLQQEREFLITRLCAAHPGLALDA